MCIAGGGQHKHVKLYFYFKLDYKLGYQFRRVLFLSHYFASVMVLLPSSRFTRYYTLVSSPLSGSSHLGPFANKKLH